MTSQSKRQRDNGLLAQSTIGLKMLYQAYALARMAKLPVWDFALSIETLRLAGVSETCLRYLIHLRWVAHGIELYRPRSRRRSFRRLANLSFMRGVHFVLTDTGLHSAPKGVHEKFSLSTEQSYPHVSDSDFMTSTPRWDCRHRQLWFDGKIIAKFLKPAPTVEPILTAFQQHQWTLRIMDPNPVIRGTNPKQRLHDAIKRLNAHVERARLRFSGDGTGRGICWWTCDQVTAKGRPGREHL
jgi:hypothetical protein